MAGYLLANQASLICHRQKAVEKIPSETNKSINPPSPRDPENCGKTKIVFKSLRCRRGSQIMSFSVQNFKLLLLSNTFFKIKSIIPSAGVPACLQLLASWGLVWLRALALRWGHGQRGLPAILCTSLLPASLYSRVVAALWPGPHDELSLQLPFPWDSTAPNCGSLGLSHWFLAVRTLMYPFSECWASLLSTLALITEELFLLVELEW